MTLPKNRPLTLSDVSTDYENYDFTIINEGISIETELFNKTSFGSSELKLTHKKESNLVITMKENNKYFIRVKRKKK